ncbi:MAG TPA: isochorismatase family cysteine hydrolase [Methanocella sp.]|nr:isochorismatase family cysteine hydrolase [Methanocella sp.]
MFTADQVLGLARKAYESNPSFTITSEKCALIVIDMQDEFVRPGWTPYWVPEATAQVPRIRMLIDRCRERSVPVIYTVFSKTHGYVDRPATGSSMPNRYADLDIDQSCWFVDGRIWRDLQPTDGEIVIHKPSYGAFYDTPLETILRNLGKDTVIVSGTMTNYCCGMTARQAFERGFKVVFGSDVNATDDQQMQESELKVLRRGFAKVLSSDEIISTLGGGV